MLLYLENKSKGDFMDIEVCSAYWMDMSIPNREKLLRDAILQYKKPWRGPTIAEMAARSNLEELPVFFSFAYLAPLMINQIVPKE